MSTVKPRRGRPKDEAKGGAILQAAAECFLKHGFQGVSMDTIAREAGVSKLTVYSHFENKESLFKEVIRGKCSQHSAPESFLELARMEPRKALTLVATGFMHLMLTPEVMAMYRVVTGESAKNPKIAALLDDAGPRPTLAAFADLLKAYTKAGVLDVRQPDRAADHFFSMLKGHLVTQVTTGVAPPPPAAEVKRHVDDCVNVFLRAYAPR